MPQGRGSAGEKKQKKKSKAQMEKELLRKGTAQPVQPMTVEVIKPKRRTEEDW